MANAGNLVVTLTDCRRIDGVVVALVHGGPHNGATFIVEVPADVPLSLERCDEQQREFLGNVLYEGYEDWIDRGRQAE